MYSYLKKKKRGVTKRYGQEVGVKTGCNAIVWCHVSKNNLTRLTKTSATKILSIN